VLAVAAEQEGVEEAEEGRVAARVAGEQEVVGVPHLVLWESGRRASARGEGWVANQRPLNPALINNFSSNWALLAFSTQSIA
jgi:hypothetical protein